VIGPGGGTISSASWRSSCVGSSNAAGTVVCGYFDPVFMPNSLKVQYEISGVASSASAGTMTGWLSVGRDIIS
jgi:hypothetical protein